MNARVNHVIGSFISIWKSSHLATADESADTDPHHMYEERVAESYLRQMKNLDFPLLEHSHAVAQYAQLMAKRLGFTAADERRLRYSCLLHDVGMLGVEKKIVEKRGWLTSDEWKRIKTHPLNTVTILSFIPRFRQIIPIVKHHHERYAGTGYPNGLMADTIPLMSRIIMIADTFEALTNDRPYRRAVTTEEALEAIDRGRGIEFDPGLVDIFITAVSEQLKSSSSQARKPNYWAPPVSGSGICTANRS